MAILYFEGAVSGTLGIVLMVAATICAITSLIFYYPLYPIFGIKLRDKKIKEMGLN